MVNKIKISLKNQYLKLNNFLFKAASLESLKQERRVIFFLIFSLTLIGLLFIYEASSLYSLKYQGDAAYFLKRQALFFLVSLVLFYGVLFFDLNFLREQSKKALLGLLIILALLPVVGETAGGARRWINLVIFSFQPSELLKIFFLIYCADYCSRKKMVLKDFKQGLMPLLIITGLICFLLLLQPDLGGVIFWIAWLLIFVYLFGARIKHLLLVILSGVVSIFFLIILYPYRLRRITAYLDPFADPLGSGFQLIQSQLAYGRGGLFGVGLGDGKQKLFFLPAAHTDFIFSIIAEELGFLLVAAIIFIFLVLIHKMFKIVRAAKGQFEKGLLVGIVIIFFLEVFINIGVTCGLIPTKGMPLPFISYGGTNLIVHFFLLGLFFNASKQSVKSKDFKEDES